MSSSSPVVKSTPALLSDRAYALLKHFAAIVLPAAGALYFALAQIWHFPNPEQVVGSIAALNAFLGIVMGISQVAYDNSGVKYSGDLLVGTGSDGTKQLQLSINSADQVEALGNQKDATFKVVQP